MYKICIFCPSAASRAMPQDQVPDKIPYRYLPSTKRPKKLFIQQNQTFLSLIASGKVQAL